MIYNTFYRITNLLDGKFYYGVHMTRNLNDSYMGGGDRIRRAIRKYGKENFKKEILVLFDRYEEALDYEEKMVNEELLKDPHCYNLKPGGKGGSFKGVNKGKKHSSLQTKRHNEFLRQRKHTKEELDKMKAYSHPEEAKRKMAEKHKKPIVQYDLNGDFIKEWDSTISASNELFIHNGSISGCLNHKWRCLTAGGFIWKFKKNITNGDEHYNSIS